MDTQTDKATTEAIDELPKGEEKRYGKLVRLFREGFLSVAVYKNVYTSRTFYDIVVYRKIKTGMNGGYDYRRGANLKPNDLPQLIRLLQEAEDYLGHI